MSDAHTIELTVPGLLQFRDLAVRVVMESCKLLGRLEADATSDSNRRANTPSERFDFNDQFTVEFTSAFQEIFNNIPKHAYGGSGGGSIRFDIEVGHDHLIVNITDTGKSFDISEVPLPDDLPISGMGLHIARTMLDELHYEPGPPNRWRLVKYVRQPASDHSGQDETTASD
jgi:anti-sigma regulatory factor (Ser/Thr protein kinase)